MKDLPASCSASISELKNNPSALIEQAGGKPIAILDRNKTIAYLVPAEAYEWLMDLQEDYHSGLVIRRRQGEKYSPWKSISMKSDMASQEVVTPAKAGGQFG